MIEEGTLGISRVAGGKEEGDERERGKATTEVRTALHFESPHDYYFQSSRTTLH